MSDSPFKKYKYNYTTKDIKRWNKMNIEEFYIDMAQDPQIDKICVEAISEQYALFLYSREYEFEKPHITLINGDYHPLAKILLPNEKTFKESSRLKIVYLDKNFTFDSCLKNTIKKWLLEPDPRLYKIKMTNLEVTHGTWNHQVYMTEFMNPKRKKQWYITPTAK